MTIKLKFNNDWPHIAALLKSQFPALPETELQFKPGGEEYLVERLSSRLKLPQEDVRALLLKMKIKAGAEFEPVS